MKAALAAVLLFTTVSGAGFALAQASAMTRRGPCSGP